MAGGERDGEVGADEAGAAGDQQAVHDGALTLSAAPTDRRTAIRPPGLATSQLASLDTMRRLARSRCCWLLLGAGSAQALTLRTDRRASTSRPTSPPTPATPNRLFVVEREGKIELVDDGVASQFADLSSKVECNGCCQGERGLMSIALAPDFDSSGRLYVDYANDDDRDDPRRRADRRRRTTKAPSSRPWRRCCSDRPLRQQANHNGGQLQFGPDGDPLHLDRRRRRRQRRTPQLPEPRPACSARSSALDPRRSRNRPTPQRSGATACATPSASPSTAKPATW